MLLLVSITANAKFTKASVTFNDGHTETGYVSSFLEDEFFNNFGSIAHRVNLDDRTIKFKTDLKGDARKILIDDIDEVNLIDEKSGMKQKFKVLYLRKIDHDRNFVDTDKRIFLHY